MYTYMCTNFFWRGGKNKILMKCWRDNIYDEPKAQTIGKLYLDGFVSSRY